MGDLRTDDFADLEAITRSLRGTAADDLHALLNGRERDAAGPRPHPASLLPRPEFPREAQHAGTVRWSCPHGCGWSHTERPGLERPGPLVLPVDFRPEDVTEAITRRATASHQALQERVREALATHYSAAHPEHKEP